MLILMSEVTRILSAIERGDPHAAEQLLPLVYDELRKLAALRMASEKPGHTLNATALVHEAYLRLIGDQKFDNRGHLLRRCQGRRSRERCDRRELFFACRHRIS
jgi:ECF sigma factor